MKLFPIIFIGILAAAAARADDFIGQATVIDGDTLEIRGQKIRLLGIDAPESRQTCIDANGEPWRCGQRAALALSGRVGQATVTCRGDDWDRYGRLVAVCRAGGEDLSAWLVSEGLALAYRRYSQAYVMQEDEARLARRGLWAGMFQAPWDWRKAN